MSKPTDVTKISYSTTHSQVDKLAKIAQRRGCSVTELERFGESLVIAFDEFEQNEGARSFYFRNWHGWLRDFTLHWPPYRKH